LVLALLAVGLFGFGQPALGRDPPYKIATWALPLGAQARVYEIFCGLKAMLTFLNRRGGIDGRLVDFYSQEMDDATPNFPARLNTMLQQAQPDLVVGGAVFARSGETADYIRRTNMVWFGPWSQRADLYRGEPTDPVGLLPSQDRQLELLLGHAAGRLGPGGRILMVWQDGGRSEIDPGRAKAAAGDLGLEMDVVSIEPGFRDWGSLRDRAEGFGAVLMWVPSGPAAAVVRTLKPAMPDDVLFLTHALNPPGLELLEMTGGLWDRIVFPSVLVREPVMAQAYDAIIQKYGPPGLEPNYMSYLGVAQAQILTRLLASRTNGTTREAMRRDMLGVDGRGTMLAAPAFGAGPPPADSSFLARVSRTRGWVPVED
jgi:ABC-type branched-subunit amino acid transport system substrate-binding protein